MERSVSLKQDYVMITYNPVEEQYIYLVYHAIDICEIEGKRIVNLKIKDKNTQKLRRVALPDYKFYDLISKGILTRLENDKT